MPLSGLRNARTDAETARTAVDNGISLGIARLMASPPPPRSQPSSPQRNRLRRPRRRRSAATLSGRWRRSALRGVRAAPTSCPWPSRSDWSRPGLSRADRDAVGVRDRGAARVRPADVRAAAGAAGPRSLFGDGTVLAAAHLRRHAQPGPVAARARELFFRARAGVDTGASRRARDAARATRGARDSSSSTSPRARSASDSCPASRGVRIWVTFGLTEPTTPYQPSPTRLPRCAPPHGSHRCGLSRCWRCWPTSRVNAPNACSSAWGGHRSR